MLEFRNLCAGYEGSEKLHSISARLKSGRMSAIIGPNGCGKTTLLKCAAGLLRPYVGDVLLHGQSLNVYSSRERAQQLAYMPQSRLAPEISLMKLVLHGRYPHLKWGRNPGRIDLEIAEAAIRRANLNGHEQHSVNRLSGGERQRAYLAMMLAQQSPVMLLDEPAAHLDLSSQFQLMELLLQLRSEGHCIAIVMHDLPMALEYADDILLMQDGQLIAAGTPCEIHASGLLQQVFGVDVHRIEGGKYICSPLSPEVSL